MRFLRRFWMFGLALAILINFSLGRLTPPPTNPNIVTDLTNTTVSTVFLLSPGQTLTYSIPGDQQPLKMITNALIPADQETTEPVAYQLALRFHADNTHTDRLMQFKTKIVRYLEKNGKPFLQTFYSQPKIIPSAGKVTILRGTNTPTTIQIQAGIWDPAIKAVAIRFYRRELNAEYKRSLLWRRLSKNQRLQKNRGNIYPLELLSNTQKHQLMSVRWQPVAPNGIAERDFATGTLYTLKDHAGHRDEPLILPEGLVAGPWRHATIQLPDNKGNFTLELIQRMESTNKPTATLNWYGKGVNEHIAIPILENQSEIQFTPPEPGGLLEITSTVLSVYQLSQQSPVTQKIIPIPVTMRVFFVGPQNPLRYQIDHLPAQPTPIRIDLRPVLSTLQLPAPPALVVLRFLDATGNELRQTSLEVASEPSKYDYLHNLPADMLIGEPLHKYSALPSQTHSIEITSNLPVAVSVLSRPFKLTRQIRLPEDHDPMTKDRQPAWFTYWPTDKIERIKNSKSAILTLQRRPIAQDPDILAGRYEWQSYKPQGTAWTSRYLLQPYKAIGAIKDQALSSVYCPFNNSQAIRLLAPFGKSKVTPSLLYVRETTDDTALQIKLDGKLFQTNRIRGKRGEIQLTKLNAGAQHIQIQSSEKIEWFINYCGVNPNNLIKRFINRIDASGLQYEVEKKQAGTALISAYYHNPQLSKRAILDISITGIGIQNGLFDGWSFRQRRLDILPDTTTGLPILGTNEQVDAGHHFFLALAEDVPVGKYTITVRLQAGAKGYIRLSQLRPGIFERNDIYIQQSVFEE